jgi:outer membrane protein assembly factor BamB
VALAACAALAGCGGGAVGAFSPTFPDSDAGRVASLAARLASAPAREERSVVVGVTTAPAHLFAWDAGTGRLLWKVPSAPRSVPVIAGDVVLTDEGGRIVGRSLDDGRTVYETSGEQLHLVGGDGEGSLSAFVLSTGGGVGARSRMVLLDRGRERWVRSAEHAVGVPAVRAGLVLFPWGSQNVSVFDAGTGEEVDRLRITDDVVGHALVDGRDVYVGQSGLFRVTPSLATGSKTRAAYVGGQPSRDLPGRPRFLRDAYTTPPAPDGAASHVRLDWAPAGAGEEVSLADGTLYLVFYRLVFALTPDGARARWVAETASDVAGVQVRAGRVALVEESGRLTVLAADDGRVLGGAELGVRVDTAALRGDAGAAVLGRGARAAAPRPPLRDQLLAASENPDNRLVPARMLAVELLAALDEPEVTTHLIAICDGGRVPPPIQEAACQSLSRRTVGGDQIVAALGRRASFLEGRSPPAVGALARAAARLGERRAVALLAGHLLDPNTRAADLAPTAEALGALGDRAAEEPLERFVMLYHAEAPDPALAAALGAALDALVALVGPAAEETLAAVIDGPFTMPAVRERAEAARARLASRPPGEAASGTDATDRGAEAAAGGEPDARPRELTAQHLEAALREVRPQLVRCLAEAPRRPMSVRIVVVADNAGAVSQVTADDAAECIAPLVRGVRLPATRGGARQQVTYTFRR